jgi:ElaB/YqjD/DUF883 family membrane-anchored ribosome-binding protein
MAKMTEVEAEMAMRHERVSGNGVEARLEALKSDLDALQEDMRGLLTDVKGVASNGVADAMHIATATAGDAVERVEDWANDNADVVRAAVRKQPLAACALSMSAGALIGALFLRH